MKTSSWSITRFCSALAIVAGSVQLAVAVENANIEVDGSGVITIPVGQSTADFAVTGNGTTGVIPIQIGASASDDPNGGILIGSVSELGRDVLDSMSNTERLWSTPSVSFSGGSLSLVTRKAGADNPDTLFPGGAVFDANVNAGYFPFSEGWVGGTLLTNGGTSYNEFVLNGLTSAEIQQDALGAGYTEITIPGVEDTRRQGILLANSAQNNNVMTFTSPSSDGSSFFVKTGLNNDNGAPATDGEDFSFVFVPIGTPNMTVARVHPGHSTQAPEALISSGDAITLVHEAQGRIRLSIAGQSPSTGSLLLTQHGVHDDPDGTTSGGRSGDNVPSFVADGNDWIILSEDLDDTDPIDGQSGGVATNFPEGQDGNGHNPYFDLAFIPFSGGPSAPGAVPALSTVTGFNTSRVIGWNADITAFSNDNGPGGMRGDATSASTGISVSGIGSNRGDLHFWVDGAPLSSNEGIMLATVSEGLRDNSVLGGHFEYGLASVFNGGGNKWQVATATADPVINAEHNIDTSFAFFGFDSGFEVGIDFDDDGTNGLHNISFPGANSIGDGVLMATAWGNEDNFAAVSADPNTGGWSVLIRDNGLGAEGGQGQFNNGYAYAYLPYETQNLVAGRVEADGSLIDSTDPSGFTLTRQATGKYLLEIDGKTFDDGMLLLNATIDDPNGGVQDNTLAYERSGDDFMILGLDMITSEEGGLGQLVDPEDTSFSFAFVDFVDELVAPPSTVSADFDNSGFVDALDFLTLQRGFGLTGQTDNSNGDANGDGVVDSADVAVFNSEYGNPAPLASSVSTVPEPGTAILVGFATCCGCLFRRRR